MTGRNAHLQTPLSTDAGRAARVGEVMREAAMRLRGVCGDLSEWEFAALLRHIAEVTVKYEAIAELRAVRIPTPPEPRTPPDDPSRSK